MLSLVKLWMCQCLLLGPWLTQGVPQHRGTGMSSWGHGPFNFYLKCSEKWQTCYSHFLVPSSSSSYSPVSLLPLREGCLLPKQVPLCYFSSHRWLFLPSWNSLWSLSSWPYSLLVVPTFSAPSETCGSSLWLVDRRGLISLLHCQCHP